MSRPRITYANVVATLALFLALAGGTAFATGALRRGSVTQRIVHNNSLLSADLKNGKGVAGVDVVDGRLAGADFGGVGGADIADGTLDATKVGDGSVRGEDLGKGAIGTANLAPGAIDSARVVDGSITGKDIATDTVTGANIVESSLGRVPEASSLEGLTFKDFLSPTTYTVSSALAEGTEDALGNFQLTVACQFPNDVMVGGGPLDTGGETTVIESARKNNVWTVRVHHPNTEDKFTVHAVCTRH